MDDTIVVVDAGGGTVDLILYTITRLKPILEVEEAAPGSGTLCGSTFLNKRFKEFLTARLGNEEGFDDEVVADAIDVFEKKVAAPQFPAAVVDTNKSRSNVNSPCKLVLTTDSWSPLAASPITRNSVSAAAAFRSKWLTCRPSSSPSSSSASSLSAPKSPPRTFPSAPFFSRLRRRELSQGAHPQRHRSQDPDFAAPERLAGCRSGCRDEGSRPGLSQPPHASAHPEP